MNVIIFGESGSGKSSTINLLLGKQSAEVCDSAVGCTFDFKKYEMPNYTLYDTVGLSEGNEGTRKQSVAVKQLVNLLKSLQDGVSLLVFVMEKGRIKTTLDQNYKLFVEAICMKKVPVVLLLTHFELDNEPEKWWSKNKDDFEKYGMKFCAVICGCCMSPERARPEAQSMIKSLNESTLKELTAAIQSNMLKPGWKVVGGLKSWLPAVLNFFLGWLLPANLFDGINTLYNLLTNQGFEPRDAKELAEDITKGL